MKRLIIILAAAALTASCSHSLKDGSYELHVLSTNDVHGTWFDESYTGGAARKSIFAMNHYIDSVRAIHGAENVALIDAGDCLQGDNAAYYFNYVDTLSPHIFPRIMGYMGYDAIAVGNHDIETGHPVYDRVAKDLDSFDAPFLAANAIRTDGSGKAYFPEYKVFRKAGLKIAVIGYTNANIKAWLTEELWSGMTFEKIMDQVQGDVDRVKARERPDVMIVAMHSGCGRGDGLLRENEALDVFNSVKGVDFLVCGHDHRPNVITRDTTALLNSGSHSRFVAHGTLKLEVSEGKITSKSFGTELIAVKAEKADTAMKELFHKDFEAVKEFTLKPVGTLDEDLRTRDAYAGMSPYINLIHAVSLSCCPPAEISFAAPLTYNGTVKAGGLVYNDLFTIYPFENQLFVVSLTGKEIVDYLEASYDNWINTVSGPSSHVLKIRNVDDPRTQQKGWSFVGRTYNFDSAAGINYTVDVTRRRGERIKVSSMADGSAFEMGRSYNVAMTSYRASGGGALLEAAGIGNVDDRVVARYPEIREIIYKYLLEHGAIRSSETGDGSLIGSWRFVPEKMAGKAVERDMALVFGK